MVAAAARACNKCGTPVSPGSKFCGECGADISAEQALVTTANLPTERPSLMDDRFVLGLLQEATLGHYNIEGELGRGGMAVVYLAHDIQLERKVAIKVMSTAALGGVGMSERFKREAKTSAKLQHPHIIPIHGVHEYESEDGAELLYFVMKFVSGRALDSILQDVGKLPIPIVQTVLDQAGNALGYAHRKGVIHRDIKPGNVMIDEEGYAVVADFGIAKELDAENLTQSGAAVGTPTYMSPEQCQGVDLSGATDQYSLGIVGYEMITGERPFTGDTIMEIMKKHFFDDPPPIGDLRPDCPPRLRSVIEKMLAKDPAERYATMEDAVAALGSVSLPANDPARTQMVDWAKQGAELQQMARLSTPRSPAPTIRSTRRTEKQAQPRSGGNWFKRVVFAGVTLVALGGVGYVAADLTGILDRLNTPADTLTQQPVTTAGTNPDSIAVTPQQETPEATTDPDPVEPPPAAPTTGDVVVVGIPSGGRVTIDGVNRGGSFAIVPGAHVAVMSAPGYTTATVDINVVAGQETRVNFAATREPAAPAMGTLRVTIQFRGRNTYANILVDGVDQGRHNGLFETQVTAGVAHTIRMVRANFATVDTTVTVTAGQTTNLVLRLVQP